MDSLTYERYPYDESDLDDEVAGRPKRRLLTREQLRQQLLLLYGRAVDELLPEEVRDVAA